MKQTFVSEGFWFQRDFHYNTWLSAISKKQPYMKFIINIYMFLSIFTLKFIIAYE